LSAVKETQDAYYFSIFIHFINDNIVFYHYLADAPGQLLPPADNGWASWSPGCFL